jgi:hypothetical protein
MDFSWSAVRHSHSTHFDSLACLDQKSQKISRLDISRLICSFHFSPGRIDRQSRKTSIPVNIWRDRIRPITFDDHGKRMMRMLSQALSFPLLSPGLCMLRIL